MFFLPEWAPNVHPLLVHFPIALLIGAFLMDVASLFLKKEWWSARSTAVLYFVGAVFALLTYITGGWAADSVNLPAPAQEVLSEHADWALYTVWFFGIYSVIRLAVAVYREVFGRGLQLVFTILALVGVFMLYETGEHGGKLVFGYQVGTGQLMSHEKADTTPGPTKGFQSSEGQLDWMITPLAGNVLRDQFNWIKGEPEQMSVDTAGSPLLTYKGADELFFVSHDDFGDMQYHLQMKASKSVGDIFLVHHYHGPDNYDYMSLAADGTLKLGRLNDGERQVFEETQTTLPKQQLMDVRIVTAGDHFRGYVNDELVLHGHGEAPSPGAIGLRLMPGSGLSIKAMNVKHLKAEEEHEEHDEHGESEESEEY